MSKNKFKMLNGVMLGSILMGGGLILGSPHKVNAVGGVSKSGFIAGVKADGLRRANSTGRLWVKPGEGVLRRTNSESNLNDQKAINAVSQVLIQRLETGSTDWNVMLGLKPHNRKSLGGSKQASSYKTTSGNGITIYHDNKGNVDAVTIE